MISVHSVVSLDFAIAQLPGWHSTIFPPYFVVGAIYSGLRDGARCWCCRLRRAFGLYDIITEAHLDAMAKLHARHGTHARRTATSSRPSWRWYSAIPHERTRI